MSEITLLDGGMGQELVARSSDAPTPLWATQVMLDHPGMVAEIHRDFFAAGASVATTNTYAIHHDRLAGTPFDYRFEELIGLALDEAETARAEAGGGRIAGSLGPLVASYRPDVHPPRDTAVPLYAELAALMAPRVDLILCETVASVDHAGSVLDGARAAGKLVWLSVTVDDEAGRILRSGEPVAALAGLAPDAWLANCAAPEAMAGALEVLAGFGKPFGAYANGFAQITKEFLKDKPTVDALEARRDMGPQSYADFVMRWVDQGASIVGGCCEVGPDHIREIARRLRAAGHVIV
ncbi:MAG: homocysteine S-methyltransferase family protein [Alphaproteobacteria bacterium]|nr:homocysteine S-methyltransferase family protein [Alphaproteobacteria bacterium]